MRGPTDRAFANRFQEVEKHVRNLAVVSVLARA
jgi:hypothetical protein